MSDPYELAIACHRQGDLDRAEQLYRQILTGDPNHAGAIQHLGVIALQKGDAPAAVLQIARAIQLDPTRASYHNNLAIALHRVGRLDDAEASARRAILMTPAVPDWHVTLGQVLAEQYRYEKAILSFREALRLNPRNVIAARGVADSLAHMGYVEQAAQAFHHACAHGGDPLCQFGYTTLLPLVYRSMDDLRSWRERLIAGVDQLQACGVQIAISDSPTHPVFALAHQGFNDRDVQQKIAGLHRPPPDLPLHATPRQLGTDSRIRVGFISAYFNRHTIGKLTRRLIAEINREQFIVVVLSAGMPAEDEVAHFIREQADDYIILPMHLPTARKIIVDAKLDVLFYCELGMDMTCYTLAYSRLAPVQCVTWGHPSTTGINTIDYFVSSDWMERDDAQEHYTERLVRLKSLTFQYSKPTIPQPLQGRQAMNLPDGMLYLCPQSIYKFHPEFDPILAGILRRDRNARLILISWASPHGDELLRQRFAAVMPDVVDRIHFIPRMDQDRFLNLLAVCDVLLDPIHFGGGWTGIEGLTVGTPIVTLPGKFLRSRLTMAMYRRIGVTECIADSAEQYVEIATRLGMDGEYRRQISEKILANNHVLFEGREAVDEMEAFFHRAVRRGFTI